MAPHPLLARFPRLCPSFHSACSWICSQVGLPLLLVLDEERFRVFAVGAQESVQRVLRLLVGLTLHRKDENNEGNELHGHVGWVVGVQCENVAALPAFNTAPKSPTSVFTTRLLVCRLEWPFDKGPLTSLIEALVRHVAQCLCIMGNVFVLLVYPVLQ